MKFNRRRTDNQPQPIAIRYADQSLDYLATVYQDHLLHEYGISFETFCECPDDIMRAIIEAEVRPPLLRQRTAALRIERDDVRALDARYPDEILEARA